MKKNTLILSGLIVAVVCLRFVANHQAGPAVNGPLPTSSKSETRTKTQNPETRLITPASNDEHSLQNSPDRSDVIRTISPKQLAIRESVVDEKEYRTLATVDDPLVQSGWQFSAVQATQAWDRIDPEKQAIVAVIDSGFALEHEDLSDQWHVNSGETGLTEPGDTCWTGMAEPKQDNNCDDDSNGYQDDWRGWDFYYLDNDPQAGLDDPEGRSVSHGTEVAGLVGAKANNGLGVAAVGYTNKIMPLQVMSDQGIGYTSDITAAVYYAVDNGADVINMSLGGAYSDEVLRAALQYAYDNQVLVVAAAGNCGVMVNDGVCNNLPPQSITYPALYETVIAVGATTQAGARASFSSFGDQLDLVAPGDGSLSSTTWSVDNGVDSYADQLYGTSYAAPIVASVAGVVSANDPAMSLKLVKAILVANSQKLTPMASHLYTHQLGHGLLDANQAFMLSMEYRQNADTPVLLMTGAESSEHTYSLTTVMGAGCSVPMDAWCAVWISNDDNDDRYTPFAKAAQDQVSWFWNTASLHGELWTVRAVSGEHFSSDYTFRPK